MNTDAEGRMAMLDVLAHMKEKALNEVNPHLMTIATLTGKVIVRALVRSLKSERRSTQRSFAKCERRSTQRSFSRT